MNAVAKAITKVTTTPRLYFTIDNIGLLILALTQSALRPERNSRRSARPARTHRAYEATRRDRVEMVRRTARDDLEQNRQQLDACLWLSTVSRERVFICTRPVDGRNRDVQQAQIHRELAAVMIIVI